MLLSDSFSKNQTLDYFNDFLTLFIEKIYYTFKANNKRPKTYKYTKFADNYSFVIEAVSGNSLKYYMTAYGIGIRAGDFIVVSDRESSVTFTVENIDYYLDPPDLWIACLIKSELP